MKIQTELYELIPHKDAFETPIRVGDIVIFNALHRSTLLHKGVVVGHTKERVRLIEVSTFPRSNGPRDTATTTPLGGMYNLAQTFCPGNVAVAYEPLPSAALDWFKE